MIEAIEIEKIDSQYNPVDINFFNIDQEKWPIIAPVLLKLSSELKKHKPDVSYIEYFPE